MYYAVLLSNKFSVPGMPMLKREFCPLMIVIYSLQSKEFDILTGLMLRIDNIDVNDKDRDFSCIFHSF